MSKILLITVGGSPQPIITAVQSLNPDRVVFVCSGGSRGSETQIIGEGKPCEIRQGAQVVDRLPNLPTYLELGDRFQANRDLITISDPDDLSQNYRAIAEKVREIRQELPQANLLADYTGGTKTMSVALAMVALDYGAKVHLTTNTTRENLIRVEAGERVEAAAVSSVTVNRTVEQFIPRVLQQYNYPAAIAELKILLQNMELSQEDRLRIEQLLDCCEGLDAWDKFDHRKAIACLRNYLKEPALKDLILFLKRVMGSRQEFAVAIGDEFETADGINGHGYEIVEDILLNAERRATLARYDDAVARLYRALELLVQVRLWEGYQIQTGDVDVTKLPASLQEKYEAERSPTKGKIQLALTKSYELLAELPDDPLGKIYLEYKDKLLDILTARNDSILAHGMRPVTKNQYQQIASLVKTFVTTGIDAVVVGKKKHAPVQFPLQLPF
jgi:CRISPR-associated protein (TIGR02710 family)